MSTTLNHERMTVELNHDIVVFLIGMRINAWWKPWRWLPVAFAMQRMLRELQAKPDSGLLGIISGGPGVMVQYWRSFDHLAAYATDRSGQHYPAWADFNKKLKKSGDVGIWHETFIIPRDNVECVYHHVPPTGLGTFTPLVPAAGHRHSARQRMKAHQPTPASPPPSSSTTPPLHPSAQA